MGMRNAILRFHTQFEYDPEIINSEGLGHQEKFIIAGMGGSNLVGELLKIREPSLQIMSHRNYGLPSLPRSELQESLVIANSYSGNTEETIDALEEALKRGFPAAAVATGGKLLEIAEAREIPYIKMPATGIQPRSALGFSTKATLKLMGRNDLLSETSELAKTLDPIAYESEGKSLAERLEGRVPVIYGSEANRGIAYNWKIKFNETGKIPAFFNVFPELNHNEMTGFDPVSSPTCRRHVGRRLRRLTANGVGVKEPVRRLSAQFSFLFLRDPADRPPIQKRMEVAAKLFRDRGLPVEMVKLSGVSVFHKIFSSLVLADWAAYYTAERYGLEAEQVPMVEEFKKLISS